jgi:hypothetical protein
MTNTRAERTVTANELKTPAGDERGYQTRPFLKIRRGYTDLLTATRRKNIIHGLVEIDVTDAHRLLRHREAAGEDLSFTAFLIHAVARAVDEDRIMHAYRRRGRLILFNDVDVNTQIEATVSGQRIVQSLLIRSANHKSVEQLSSEIRAGQHHNAQSERRYRGALAFPSLPRPVRALAWRFVWSWMPGPGSELASAYHLYAANWLAGDMQNRVEVSPVKSRNKGARVRSRDGDELHAATLSLPAQLWRDRKRAVGTGTDDQLAAAPRNLLLGRQRGVTVSTPLRFRGFLDPLAHRTLLDDDVVIVLVSIDLDRSEPDQLSSHLTALPCQVYPAGCYASQSARGKAS